MNGGNYMTKTDRVQIRISPEMKAKLQALAEAENRTISNYIENLIIRELKKGE
jgi:predicted DNA-binding protein